MIGNKNNERKLLCVVISKNYLFGLRHYKTKYLRVLNGLYNYLDIIDVLVFLWKLKIKKK